MIVQTAAYPRAGLVGNPSDGFFGKTIAFTFTDFAAKIVIYESPELEILPSRRDHSVFRSLDALVGDVDMHGYYGGFRLLKATVKKFYDYTKSAGLILENKNFTLRYQSNVPGRVGLAGSSAIITACLKGLTQFYGVTIPPHIFANVVLSVETEELRIPAGLQDRVAQAYESCVFMDFDKSLMDEQGYGNYELIDQDKLPNIYVAYLSSLAEGTEVTHGDLRSRWRNGEKDVLDAMKQWAAYAQETRNLLQMDPSESRDEEIARIFNANFDLRKKVSYVSQANVELIDSIRSFGLSAKFAGSGGAYVGTYPDDESFDRVQTELAPMGVRFLKPTYCKPEVLLPAENPKRVLES